MQAGSDAAPALSRWKTEPRWHAPPCPRCGSYQTCLDATGPGVTCRSCSRRFRAAAPGIPAIFVPGLSAHNLAWSWSSRDGDGHAYSISRDQRYGRNWILEVNLFGSGYWLQYAGAFWLLRSANKAAEYFSYNWTFLLPRHAFQQHYMIHEDIVALARERINAKTPGFFEKVRDGGATVTLNP